MKGVFSLVSLLLIAHLAIGQSILNQRVTIKGNKASIQEHLQEIEAQSGLQFSYSPNFTQLQKKVYLEANAQPINKLLKRLLKAKRIDYKLIGDYLVLRQDKRKFSPANTRLKTPIKRTQTLRGKVIDTDTQIPLIGVNLRLLDTTQYIGTATDEDGQFEFSNVPLGRHQLELSYIGYETKLSSDIVLISGKEAVVRLDLKEATTSLQEVVVTTKIDKLTPLNEMASLSTRTFSVEETSRFPGSFLDPQRMVKSFAGVSSYSDLDNEVIIRGNAPINLLWRMEGVEIPNPNHFATIGASGGAISMLSSSTLANSDFMIGAFSAEYGNTLSGVFDLQLRNGNRDKKEHSLLVGALGLEFSTEGPLFGNGRSSYLINYRYSTLDFLSQVGLNPASETGIPRFHDLSFKLNFQGKKGLTLSLFGLGGQNTIAENDFFLDIIDTPLQEDYQEQNQLGVLGASILSPLNPTTYLKSTFSASTIHFASDFLLFNPEMKASDFYFEEENNQLSGLRWNTFIHHKMGTNQTLRCGVNLGWLNYDYFYDAAQIPENRYWQILDSKDNDFQLQGYAMWKVRPTAKITANAGIHLAYYGIVEEFSIEPRLSVNYQLNNKQSLDFGFGMHSALGDPSTYLYIAQSADGGVEQPARKLRVPKSAHYVLGFNQRFSDALHLKLEAYYQRQYDVPIATDPEKPWISLLNVLDNYDVFSSGSSTLANAGKGRTLGFDVTLERFFSKQFYFLWTASLYDSKFADIAGNYYNTLFNGQFVTNFVIGKEYTVQRNNTLGVNARWVLAGGNKYPEIDLERSRALSEQIIFPDRINTENSGTYYRMDFSMKYTLNRPKMTHTIYLEAQNIFNRRNKLYYYYDHRIQNLVPALQTGIIPNINYRISF